MTAAGNVKVHHGDALAALRMLPDSSIDAVVTDPPYGLADHKPAAVVTALTAWVNGDRERVPDGHGFMGRQWDAFVPPPAVWDECLRVLKPGGHMLVFAGTRTVDLMGLSIRLAGFEPVLICRKPMVGTLVKNIAEHGTGAVNIDACRVAHANQADLAESMNKNRHTDFDSGLRNNTVYGKEDRPRTNYDGSEGRWPTNVVLDEFMAAELDEQSGISTSSARPWNNTAAAHNKTTSMGKSSADWTTAGHADSGGASRFFPTFRYQAKAPTKERPKVFLPSCDCASSSTWRSGSASTDEPSLPDTRSITRTTTSSTTDLTISNSSTPSPTSGSTPDANSATESGGSRALSAVISSPSPQTTGTSPDRDGRSTDDAVRATSSAWSTTSVCGSCGASSRSVSHATVKPLALMRWLVRLVTPPGGTVLDPFAGSGTAIEAALLEGFDAIGIEAEAAYLPLIELRIARAQARLEATG